MKKILTLLLFIVVSMFSFANLTDNLNILSEENKKEIIEKIEEIKKEKNVTVFVNTLYLEEGFAISDPEKALILNLKKGDSDKYKVEVSFSKDMDVDDYQDEMNNVLKDATALLERKEYTKYILTVLDGTTEILEEVNLEPLNQMTLTKNQSNGEDFRLWPILLIMAIAGFAYKGYTMYEEKRKSKIENNMTEES